VITWARVSKLLPSVRSPWPDTGWVIAASDRRNALNFRIFAGAGPSMVTEGTAKAAAFFDLTTPTRLDGQRSSARRAT
jgi:hypothetical protein